MLSDPDSLLIESERLQSVFQQEFSQGLVPPLFKPATY